MRKTVWIICLMAYAGLLAAQPVVRKLQQAMERFEKDSQMRYAMAGFVVADATTGKILFERNGQTGLAPASTQKILTSIAAFELLGYDYRYETRLSYTGAIENGKLLGHLVVTGSGDPSLGSWRYNETRDTAVLTRWANAIRKAGISYVAGSIIVHQRFAAQAIPDGWIWQDIGNYYGAGVQQLNWRENQYDLLLKSGDNVGDAVEITDIKNGDPAKKYRSQLLAAAKGTGDNAYVYLPRRADGIVVVDGTIPAGEKSFSISGAVQDPENVLKADFTVMLRSHKITFSTLADGWNKHWAGWSNARETLLDNYLSPPLDSINYWFMRRSINLYGEALVKTIAWKNRQRPGTDEGVKIVRDFWEGQGIDKAAINMVDGSGLSPQNRVTADALVRALLFAKKRPWFNAFYASMPTFNGMKLKSGSIGGARAFAGYHGNYVMAIIVNNYAGSSAAIVKKMYAVLDEAKGN